MKVMESSSIVERKSGVAGVGWKKYAGYWEVRLEMTIAKKKVCYYGGTFKPRDNTPEETECARLAAVEKMKQLERQHRKPGAKRVVD